jgi:hypothetical protein
LNQKKTGTHVDNVPVNITKVKELINKYPEIKDSALRMLLSGT